MFHYDRGIKLTAIDLAVDVRRRQPRGFISHAHMDHMGRHEMAYCTPETARLYWHRLGERPVREMPYRETMEWDHFQLTALPAGHCWGSAMLLADDGDQRLLYTGDYKLGPSFTAEAADPPCADILIMETTFGQPAYRMPSRDQVVEQLLGAVENALAVNKTPVIHAYVLGKAQEVTRMLTSNGIPVVQHPLAYEVSQIYEQTGCPLGDVQCYEDSIPAGSALVIPPKRQTAMEIPLPDKKTTIAVTGWANSPSTRYRLGVDVAIPLSDHADYDDLFETVEMVQPQVIFCTHGPKSFVEDLRGAGHNAHWLDETSRTALSQIGS